MQDPEPATSTEAAGGAVAKVTAAGIVTLVLLSCVFSVWAWQYGAWFGTALYPGTVVLALGLVLLALFAPVRLRLGGWPAVALGALIALGLWSALSGLWSPAPDVAVEDAQRILTYAVAFGLGLSLCALLGRRIDLAMAPLAAAGLVAAAVAVVTMLSADDLREVLDKGTLQSPIGYRNANAAFFLIAAWPAVGLAASRELSWPLRALSLATATACFQLAALSQSRGSIVAIAITLAVYLVVNRDRARAVGWLLLAVAPAVLVVPALLGLYEAATELGRQATLPELRGAGHAVLLGAGLAALLGAGAALLERRYPASEKTLRRANRVVAAGAVAGAVACVVGFVVATGDPGGWISDRVDEFKTQDSPGQGRATRFNLNAGTERDDLWRVALDGVREDPLKGIGAGGFYYSYLQNRSGEGVQSARDAHSLEFEILGELGIVGIVLLFVFLVAAVGGAVRSRARGPAATALAACALTTAVYWFSHASIDWFFPFPAITAPVLALLGAACAPAVVRPGPFRRGPGWVAIAAAAIVLAVSVVAPYMSERYTNLAFERWGDDLERAYEDLERAEDLNPLADEPLLATGAIARAAGDSERAIAAFRRGTEEYPEEWVNHYFLALLLANEDPAAARRELAIATRLNPLSPRIQRTRSRLDAEKGS